MRLTNGPTTYTTLTTYVIPREEHTMSRKDDVVIAQIMHAWWGAIPEQAHREMCEEFATELHTDNERFDKDRFMKACGYI